MVTRAETDRPKGALALSRELRNRLGGDPLVRLNPSLTPNEFEVWIGGKP
jgi:hypothetical protein